MPDSSTSRSRRLDLKLIASYPGRVVRQGWRDLLSVYYTNTPIWRVLKSGGLLVFGFFCWSAASLLLSYRPDWTVLYYPMAYGFVLILWGPLTHMVVVPLAIRLRRTAQHPVTRTFARQASKLNLSTFLLIVIVLGTAPVSPMLLDFTAPISDGSNPDVNTDLVCERGADSVTCHLTNPEGVDHLVVTSGETRVAVVDDPTTEFEIPTADLEEVVGQQQFTVELRDAAGERVGAFRRNVA